MKKSRVIILIGAVGLVAIAAMSLPMTRAEAEAEHKDHHEAVETDTTKGNVKTKGFSINQIHSKRLPAVSKSIDKAIKAIKSGNSEAALEELHKAQKMLAVINEAIGRHVKPRFVNNRCPIWGTPIEPDKVTENLIRDYKGQKVAFCCAKCPSKWDKLTDVEKEAKLAKVKPKPAERHSEHKADEHYGREPAEHHEETVHEHGHGGEDVEALPAGANQMCPVEPEEKVDPSLYVEYKGKRIYVCCKKCVKRVQENPAAWYAKVYGDGHEHDH